MRKNEFMGLIAIGCLWVVCVVMFWYLFAVENGVTPHAAWFGVTGLCMAIVGVFYYIKGAKR